MQLQLCEGRYCHCAWTVEELQPNWQSIGSNEENEENEEEERKKARLELNATGKKRTNHPSLRAGSFVENPTSKTAP